MPNYRERTEHIQEKLRTQKYRRRKRVKRLAVLSSVLSVVLVFALVLFVPYSVGGYPNLSRYEESDYYPVMEKLSKIVYSPAEKTNNFKRWNVADNLFGGIGCAAAPKGDTDMAPGAEYNQNSGDSYQEVTNNQVQGVTEGDLFKRSSSTLFYLTSDYVLRAYSIAGKESALLSELPLETETEFASYKSYHYTREMFLSEDLKTVTVLSSCFGKETGRLYTAIITVNTENPRTMSVSGVQYVTGQYVSSRMQNGVLLLVNNFSVYPRPDFSDEAQFLPQYGTKDELKSLPVESIYLPETATRANYTVLATFDTARGELIDAEALLSFSDEVYVAKDNVYATNSFAGPSDSLSHTQITRIAYENGNISVAASQTIEGTVNNRYSMDEYEGHFRVFVTNPATPQSNTSASLFVMDAETMEIVSSVERFAPEGESVQSARFNGTKAYVCTAEIITMTDPVYVFDLSDPEHISSKDTGTIPGYSISLIKFKGDTLLGIGYGDSLYFSGSLKIEVYEETNDAVKSIDMFGEEANFSQEFKAYFIDSKEGLVGLGILSFKTGRMQYLLLRFDGYGLAEILRTDLTDGNYDDTRAFLADEYFYIVSDIGLVVEEI